MQERLMRRWGMLVGCLLLGACASIPGQGVPSLSVQDSLSARCLQDPVYCATAAGRELVHGPVQTVGAAAASGAVVMAALDDVKKKEIQTALEQCANLARTEVLLEHRGAFEGLVPNAGECTSMTVDRTGRSVTWAIRLGLEMHESALRCAEMQLGKLRPGGFSLKQRYRFNRETGEKGLISPEEIQTLLKQGASEQLRGTLEPDVVIHTGNPLEVLAVFDFKFRCVKFSEEPEWRRYPAGHVYAGEFQGSIYVEAFGPEVHLVGPRKGVFW